MSEPEPQVRVRYMKVFVRRIEELPMADRKAVWSSVPASHRAAVDRSSPLDWLPGDVNVELTHAVSRRLGAERAHAFYEGLLINAFDSTLMNTFVEGVLRMSGRDPGKSLKWMPSGFGLIFRNWGTWTVLDVTERRGEIEVMGLPAMCMDRDRLWVESARSSLGSIFIRANRKGVVRMTEVDDRRGCARYVLEWT
jgi:hypothetical protein